MASWRFWEGWGKRKESRKSEIELINHLNRVLDASRRYNPDKGDTTRAENVLLQIEEFLKSMVVDLKRLTENHEQRINELEADYKLLMEKEKDAFKADKKQMTKMENQMILIYDYWYREVEIQKLTSQIKTVSLSTDRKEISAKLNKLVLINAGLEKGIKERNIDPERLIELRKKIGVYEEASN